MSQAALASGPGRADRDSTQRQRSRSRSLDPGRLGSQLQQLGHLSWFRKVLVHRRCSVNGRICLLHRVAPEIPFLPVSVVWPPGVARARAAPLMQLRLLCPEFPTNCRPSTLPEFFFPVDRTPVDGWRMAGGSVEGGIPGRVNGGPLEVPEPPQTPSVARVPSRVPNARTAAASEDVASSA